MAVVEGAVTMVAPVPPEVNPGCAYGMVAVKDARWITALRVLKGFLVFASHMAVVGDVSFQHAPKVLREAPCSARHTVAGNGARLMAAPRVQKEAPLFAKVTVVENGVLLKVVVFARRVFTVEPYFVWHMAAARGARSPVAHVVQGVALIVVFAMVAGSGVNLAVVGKVLKVAPTSVRLMVVGKGARGASPVQILETTITFVMRLLGGKPGYVHLMVLWFRTNGSMVVPLWERWFTKPHPINLKK